MLRRHPRYHYYLSSQDQVDGSKHTTHNFCLFRKMGFIEIFTLCITILAVYGTVICFRSLLPCYIIPNVSTLLNDVEQCLASAMETGAIPAVSEYRANLETYGTLHSLKSSSHRLAQPCKRPCPDAYREPSFSRVFPADLACFQMRSHG